MIEQQLAAERYLPQRVIGTADEVDKDVSCAIGAISVARRVEGRRFHDGERGCTRSRTHRPLDADSPPAR